MTIIAITNCKAMKQDYACSADEMYSKSYVYRAQKEFFNKAYDKYLIFSAKYGLILPDKVIEPYDLALEAKIGRVTVNNSINEHDRQKLFNKVEKQLIKLFEIVDEVHFHTSNIYYSPFEKIFKKHKKFSNKLRRIGQQKNPPVAMRKYEEATSMFDGSNLNQCLKHISTINKGVYECEKLWFHKELAPEGIGPFKAHQVRKWVQTNHPNEKIDEGSLHKVSLSKIEQTYGWIINKEYLPQLVKRDNGSWRYKKSK